MITAHVWPALRPNTTGLELDVLVRRTIAWLQTTCCAVHGHDLLLHFDRNRICLRCAGCGFETRGWCIERPRQP